MLTKRKGEARWKTNHNHRPSRDHSVRDRHVLECQRVSICTHARFPRVLFEIALLQLSTEPLEDTCFYSYFIMPFFQKRNPVHRFKVSSILQGR